MNNCHQQHRLLLFLSLTFIHHYFYDTKHSRLRHHRLSWLSTWILKINYYKYLIVRCEIISIGRTRFLKKYRLYIQFYFRGFVSDIYSSVDKIFVPGRANCTCRGFCFEGACCPIFCWLILHFVSGWRILSRKITTVIQIAWLRQLLRQRVEISSSTDWFPRIIFIVK